jgi:dephospho-CoA kinase
VARENKHLARIGVTGGIGSGKTTVCAMFERLGVPAFSADLIAREISDTDQGVKRAIVKLIGPEAFRADGTLDRPYVSSIVFSNEQLQRMLNAIVHPMVEKEIEKRIRLLSRPRVAYVIVEAALLFEAGWERKLDAVLVVDAAEETRVRRVAERDKLEERDIRRRMTAQWTQKRKLAQADYAIVNEGPLQELEARVRFFHNLFTQLYQ